MKQFRMILKQTIVGAAAIVAFAIAGSNLSSAQEATTTSSTTTSTTEEEVASKTTAEMICEAQQRREARWQKWVDEGIPEEFGSEEPFTFNPDLC